MPNLNDKKKKVVFALVITNGVHVMKIRSSEETSGIVQGFGGSMIFNFPNSAHVTVDDTLVLVSYGQHIQVQVPATYVFFSVDPATLEE